MTTWASNLAAPDSRSQSNTVTNYSEMDMKWMLCGFSWPLYYSYSFSGTREERRKVRRYRTLSPLCLCPWSSIITVGGT